MIPMTPARIGFLIERAELMILRKRLAALFVVLALAGCASVAAGPGQAPNAPYQQSDARDTSGMH